MNTVKNSVRSDYQIHWVVLSIHADYHWVLQNGVQFNLRAFNLVAGFHLIFQTLILHTTPSVHKFISILQSGEIYSLTWHLKASSCSLRSWTSLLASFCFSWLSECARLDLVLWWSSKGGAVEEEDLGLRSRTCISGGLATADVFLKGTKWKMWKSQRWENDESCYV